MKKTKQTLQKIIAGAAIIASLGLGAKVGYDYGRRSAMPIKITTSTNLSKDMQTYYDSQINCAHVIDHSGKQTNFLPDNEKTITKEYERGVNYCERTYLIANNRYLIKHPELFK